MKDQAKWFVLIVGFVLFAALMWGLLYAVFGGRFLTGFSAWFVLMGIWSICTAVVWAATRLPFLPAIDFADCAKYAAILAVGSALVRTIIKNLHTKLPDWGGWAIGAVIAIWACTVEYRREKKGK